MIVPRPHASDSDDVEKWSRSSRASSSCSTDRMVATLRSSSFTVRRGCSLVFPAHDNRHHALVIGRHLAPEMSSVRDIGMLETFQGGAPDVDRGLSARPLT